MPDLTSKKLTRFWVEIDEVDEVSGVEESDSFLFRFIGVGSESGGNQNWKGIH